MGRTCHSGYWGSYSQCTVQTELLTDDEGGGPCHGGYWGSYSSWRLWDKIADRREYHQICNPLARFHRPYELQYCNIFSMDNWLVPVVKVQGIFTPRRRIPIEWAGAISCPCHLSNYQHGHRCPNLRSVDWGSLPVQRTRLRLVARGVRCLGAFPSCVQWWWGVRECWGSYSLVHCPNRTLDRWWGSCQHLAWMLSSYNWLFSIGEHYASMSGTFAEITCSLDETYIPDNQ